MLPHEFFGRYPWAGANFVRYARAAPGLETECPPRREPRVYLRPLDAGARLGNVRRQSGRSARVLVKLAASVRRALARSRISAARVPAADAASSTACAASHQQRKPCGSRPVVLAERAVFRITRWQESEAQGSADRDPTAGCAATPQR
jgi:hypothetical protein